jgi:hypothetical protein
MQRRSASCTVVIATLLACHHSTAERAESVRPGEDRIEEMEAVSYRGPAVPSTRLAPGTVTGALVGAVFGCDGRPLPVVQLKAWQTRTETGGGADTLVQQLDSTFILRSLSPGEWQLSFRFIGHQPRLLPVTVQSGRVDTLMVQLSMSRLLPTRDCVCANGRDFGGHCCKPVTVRVCTPRDPKMEGQ